MTRTITPSPLHPFTPSPAHPFTRSPAHPFAHSPLHSSAQGFINRPERKIALITIDYQRWREPDRAHAAAQRDQAPFETFHLNFGQRVGMRLFGSPVFD